jgi:predicted Zn-dependent protease
MKYKDQTKHLISVIFLVLWNTTSIAYAHAIEGEHKKSIYGLSHKHDSNNSTINLLKKALEKSPENSEIAAKLAKTYIQLARQKSHPAYYQDAKAILKPWWNNDQAPVEIILLRATLLQHDHHFDDATKDLLKVIRAQMNNAQAWLTLSNIQIVQGKYDDARASCDALSRVSSHWFASACFSQIYSITGQADRAYSMQKILLEQSKHAQESLRLWILGLLSDTAMRQGKQIDAEEYYKTILSISPHDTHTLRKYADLLIDQERYAELSSLLNTQKLNNHTLALRSLIAAQKAGKQTFVSQHTPILEKTLFGEEEDHHGHIHKQEQALFLLKIKQQPAQALALALDNWEIQKEFDDTAIALRAALASNNKSDIKPVLDWLSSQNVEDSRLTILVNQIKKDI